MDKRLGFSLGQAAPVEFVKHTQSCSDCRFFPISAACYTGAILLDPGLSKTTTESEYLKSIADLEERLAELGDQGG